MWLNPQFSADLVTFIEETLNGKLDFLCSEICSEMWKNKCPSLPRRGKSEKMDL